ncbi:hypothetical protein [Streptomyces hirsutus]|uniref:hypothetical protein n=1 Tax=Streptomyces hirsutus TaxID=35620 RepID=UPI003326487F
MLAESLAAVAAAGSTALVGAMATDAWQVTREGAARLFRREAGRAEPRPGLVVQLDADAALVARAEDAEPARQSLVPGWRLRLEEFLRADPEAADGLRELTERTLAALPRTEQHWVQHVNAHDRSQVFAAQGGNVIVHREAGDPE